MVLNGAGVQSLCIGWINSLSLLWRVHSITNYDIITALLNQIFFMITIQQKLIILY